MSETSDKSLKLEVEDLGSTVVMRIRGSVTIHDAESMQKQLEELTLRKVPVIALDLSEMDFICSTGLGAIILAYLRTRHHQGQIRLVNPQPAVRKLLETTRLTKLFPLYSSVAEATAQ